MTNVMAGVGDSTFRILRLSLGRGGRLQSVCGQRNSGWRDELMFIGIDEQPQSPAFDVELVIDDREVIAHRGLGDDWAQALGDLSILKPLADEGDDLALALGEARNLGGFRIVLVGRTR